MHMRDRKWVASGLGSRAQGLDFIPLLEEQYDLVIPRVHYESPLLQPLLSLLADPDFRQEVSAPGGLDTAAMGDVAAEVG